MWGAESVVGGSGWRMRLASHRALGPVTAGSITIRMAGTSEAIGSRAFLEGRGARTGSHQGWGLASKALALQGPCAPPKSREWAHSFGG